MKKILILGICALFSLSCTEKVETVTQWVHTQTILLDGVNPIGMAQAKNGLWLSDGDHNRVVLINSEGVIQKTIDSLDRPMHIAAQGDELLIPQYGNDEVVRFRESIKTTIRQQDSLDAPAGVDIIGNEIAIADFYNNKIHYSTNGNDWMTFGKEGKAEGDFYYPTDVQITEDKIWVADAYNNRIQAFDKEGNFLKAIGADQNMNAATGIFVSENEVFSTDFENNRILIFNHDGMLLQELKKDISKPTDMMISQGKLFVANYKGSSLAVYEWRETVKASETEEEQHDHDDHDH